MVVVVVWRGGGGVGVAWWCGGVGVWVCGGAGGLVGGLGGGVVYWCVWWGCVVAGGCGVGGGVGRVVVWVGVVGMALYNYKLYDFTVYKNQTAQTLHLHLQTSNHPKPEAHTRRAHNLRAQKPRSRAHNLKH